MPFSGKAFRGLGDGEGILRFLCDKSQSVKRSLSNVVISELATALTSNVKDTVAFPKDPDGNPWRGPSVETQW